MFLLSLIDKGFRLNAKTQILVIEDDPNIADIVAYNLSDMGYQVDTSADGNEGLEKALHNDFALIILDLMLPGKNGLDICKELRVKKSQQAILMLTSLDSEMDRVIGLEIGADDYLAKPFGVYELKARVKALLRRTRQLPDKAQVQQQYAFGPLSIDSNSREVMLNEATIELTAKEFDLLLHMATHSGKVFSRNQLLDEVWGYSHAGYEHTVNTHINRLRTKLKPNTDSPEFIQTVWGVGYKFVY